MDCHRQLGCSEEELRTKLSQYLDEELPSAEAEAVEDHLKECARCRDEVSELRGVDRQVSRAVGGTTASEGFVERVMAAITGRHVSRRTGGRPLTGLAGRSLVWALVAAGAIGAVVLVLVVVRAFTREGEILRPIRLRIVRPAGESGAGAFWRERRVGRRPFVGKAPGESLHAGTVIELPASAPAGEVERPDGLRICAAARTSIEIEGAATDEHGMELVKGRLLLASPDGARGFELRLSGGATLAFPGGRSRALVERQGERASVAVLAGVAGLHGSGPAVKLAAHDRATLEPDGTHTVARGTDVRALDLGFAPPGLRVSPWPQAGGSATRDGRSPFELVLPPAKVLDLPSGWSGWGGSGCVLGLDGTAFVLVGPAPGKLVGVRGTKLAFSAELESPFVGDPAVAPDGSVLVATRRAMVRVRPSAKTEGQAPSEARPALTGVAEEIVSALVTLVEFGEDEVPRLGPCVAPAGGFYALTSGGLAAYGRDGERRWRRKDIVRASLPSLGPDGTVYVATIAGVLHALDPETGEEKEPRLPPVDEPFLSPVAVAPDGTAYAVSSTRYLVWRAPVRVASGRPELDGRRAPSGRPPEAQGSGRVSLPASEYVIAPAVAPSGHVVVVSSAGPVYRLPRRPTEPPDRAFFDAGERIARRPTVVVDSRGRLVIWAASGRLVVVEPTGRSRPYEIGARDSFPAAVSTTGALHFVTRDGRMFGEAP